MPKSLTTKDFIEKSHEVHKNKYLYDKSEYINNTTPICITCPIHGDFWQIPSNHLRGKGCTKCNGGVKLTTEQFIEAATHIHDGKYIYDKSEYINNHTPVCITCPIHGDFWQSPANHNHKTHPRGCPKCHGGIKLAFQEFVDKATEIHEGKYGYGKSEYINANTKLCITCPIHGDFLQTPGSHLQGNGCPSCQHNAKMDSESFQEKAKKVHGDKYVYCDDYANTSTKVKITCPIHGDFWQTPNSHLQGHGCPKCKLSFLEQDIERFLIDNNIVFEEQKRFDWLANSDDKRSQMPLDFYLPEYNIAIECQGIQHFQKVELFEGSKYNFEYTTNNDKIKKRLCDEHDILILYYSNLHIDYPYQVFTDKDKLLEEINKARR